MYKHTIYQKTFSHTELSTLKHNGARRWRVFGEAEGAVENSSQGNRVTTITLHSNG